MNVVENSIETQYLNILEKILNHGELKENRTGVDTLYLFSEKIKGNLQNGFPLLTSKKVLFQKTIDELFWFLSGSTNIADLPEKTQVFWKHWAKEDGTIGKAYGKQFRNWEHIIKMNSASDGYFFTHKIEEKRNNYERINYDKSFVNNKTKTYFINFVVDQIAKIQYQLQNNPYDRRIVLNLWNVGELHEMALEPCAYTAVWSVIGNKLNCHLLMRSADMFLGVPHNIASYALLTHMFAHSSKLIPNEISYEFVDCHIYTNQIEAVKTQLERKEKLYQMPKLFIKENFSNSKNIDNIKKDDIILTGYAHHPFIKAEVAI